jgi:thiol:disulfide interchange protein
MRDNLENTVYPPLMHKSPILIAIVLGLLFAVGEVSLSPAAAKDNNHWLTDEKTAFGEAKKDNKFVLLEFTGLAWCPSCQALQKEVFATKKFQDYAQKLVLLRVDFPTPDTVTDKGLPLVNRYLGKGAIELPKVLVLSADGKKVGEIGYQAGGPDVFIAAVDKITQKSH